MSTSTLHPILHHFITGATAIAIALTSLGEAQAQENNEGAMAYCAAGADNVLEAIWIVDFADIYHLSTTYAGYENFLGTVAHVQQGATYPITVELDLPYPEDQVRVWIDLDKDQAFEANELMWSSGVGMGPHMGTITIPANASPGDTRMRIRVWDTLYGPNSTPCGNSDYGQVEDYTVNVQSSVGMGELGKLGMAVFPNPSNGLFFMDVADLSGAVQVDVIDLTGRIVHTEVRTVINGDRIALDLTGKLSDGAYSIRLSTSTALAEQRIVVRN